MTRYDFTTQPNRLNQNTMKWHEAESDPELLELWVADMDFLPVPEIRDAVINFIITSIRLVRTCPHLIAICSCVDLRP